MHPSRQAYVEEAEVGLYNFLSFYIVYYGRVHLIELN